ncbi:MAG TPA: hypothetical protein VH857_06545 [Actinomycetes bacterium]|nr:hypothetical protein [Actinomycetes bacterium]
MTEMRKVVAVDFLSRPPRFSPLEALTICRQMVDKKAGKCRHGATVFEACGHLSACHYGFVHLGYNDPVSAWHNMTPKYRHHGLEKMMEAPAGAVLFWKGGSAGHGHTGLADGKGNLFSNDFPVSGEFARFPIDQVAAHSNAASPLVPLGWTFPFFKMAVSDRQDPPLVTGHSRREEHIVDLIIMSQQDVIAAARKALHVRKSPADQKAYRRIITASRKQIDIAKELHAKV